MIKTKVSILIPCYNQAKFLDECLQSVLDQTFSDWECLIIDDGSPDNTNEIASNWIVKDSRFRYFFKTNGGISSARNYGIEKAKGEYIQFLDSDDLLDKRKLELSLNEMDAKKTPNLKLVISNFIMFKKHSIDPIIPFCNLNLQLFTFESLLYQWNETFSIPIHCGFFASSLFEGIRFPENLTAQEDWVVWVNIFKKDIEVRFVNEPLALYRINMNSRMMTSDIFLDQLKAYEYFRTNLTDDEFYKLSSVLISRYFKSNIIIKQRIKDIKCSNTYRGGLLIKKILKKFYILKPSIYILKKIALINEYLRDSKN